MKYKIIWSKFAIFQLDLIFNYYAEVGNAMLAKKIIFLIRDRVLVLKTSPFIGKVEALLADRPQNYRHLIISNYKVIYAVNEQTKTLRIVDIFDTRQNPKKLKRS